MIKIETIKEKLETKEMSLSDCMKLSFDIQDLVAEINKKAQEKTEEQKKKENYDWAKRVSETRKNSKAKKIAEAKAKKHKLSKLSPSRQHLLD